MYSVRWVVTLEGNRRDIEFLLGESFGRLTASDDPREVLLELDDPDHDVATDEARQAGKVAIDAAVRRLNGFGKLRWGRTYEGIAVKTVQNIDSSGGIGQVVFAGPAYDHMLPEDFADMVERLGFPRPRFPRAPTTCARSTSRRSPPSPTRTRRSPESCTSSN
jgi:hypothetical protein